LIFCSAILYFSSGGWIIGYNSIFLRCLPRKDFENGCLLMTPEEIIKRCDENTIGVVPTLGVTFTGGEASGFHH
jgi:hypothetical protein